MNCPKCKTPMIVLELDQVETDYCPECRGIWLDTGELEILFEDAARASDLLHSFAPSNTNELPRKCPICRKKMQKIHVGSDKNILIDRCNNSHGLWFDRGELLNVIQGTLDADGKIVSLLKEMYSKDTKI